MTEDHQQSTSSQFNAPPPHERSPPPPEKSEGGRPLELTPELSDRIVEAIRLGNYLETAAALAGVTSKSVRNWLRRGTKGNDPIFVAFAQAVLCARATAEQQALERISSDPSWQAQAWRLE